ncbi:hypothetical protein [Pseudomonas sp. ZS001]
MTIDIEILSAPNISIPNEVFNISRPQGGAAEAISVASLMVAESSSGSLVLVLDCIFSLIEKNLLGYDIWFFVGNSAWQPDTRVIRYRKLWGALRFRGNEVVGGSELQERMVETDGRLKFFGAVRLSRNSVESLAKILEVERCSYIAALPSGFDVKSILDVGWSGNVSDDLDLHYLISEKKGLLFRRLGEFDEGEQGLLSTGSSEVMGGLLNGLEVMVRNLCADS